MTLVSITAKVSITIKVSITAKVSITIKVSITAKVVTFEHYRGFYSNNAAEFTLYLGQYWIHSLCIH